MYDLPDISLIVCCKSSEDADSSRVLLDTEFHKDLNWFLTFLSSFNRVTMYDIRPISGHIYLDACLTGLGGATVAEW